ncbi:hypothetical protein GEMRC1_008241 [Eukaryota sp. GEM-RC1]
MEDTDYNSSFNRADLEAVSQPLLTRIQSLCASLLPSDFNSTINGVVGLGGASRIPSVASILATSFGHESVLRTLNPEEDISTGAAYQAAMLSPMFKVRDVTVIDLGVPKTITCEYPTASDELHRVDLFPAHCQVPLTRKINLVRRPEPFNVVFSYPDHHVATWTIGGFPDHLSKSEDYKIKLQAKVSGDLLLEPSKTYLSETVMVDVEVPVQEEKTETPAESPEAETSPEMPEKKLDAEEVPTPMEGEEPETNVEETTKEKQPEKVEKKTKIVQQKKVVQHRLIVSPIAGFVVPQEIISNGIKFEEELMKKDLEYIEATEAKVQLESFVYGARSDLSTSLYEFIDRGEAEVLTSKLNSLEDWLYDDGFDCPKTVYQEKLAHIRAPVDQAKFRLDEWHSRTPALESLKHSIEKYTELVGKKDTLEEYSHLEASDWKGIEKEIKSASKSLSKYISSLSSLSKLQNPPVLSADVTKRMSEFETAVGKILHKPKPEPKKEEEKPEKEPVKTEEKTEEPIEEESKMEGDEQQS